MDTFALVLVGPSVTGKSTMAYSLLSLVNNVTYVINAKNKASSSSSNPKKEFVYLSWSEALQKTDYKENCSILIDDCVNLNQEQLFYISKLLDEDMHHEKRGIVIMNFHHCAHTHLSQFLSPVDAIAFSSKKTTIDSLFRVLNHLLMDH